MKSPVTSLYITTSPEYAASTTQKKLELLDFMTIRPTENRAYCLLLLIIVKVKFVLDLLVKPHCCLLQGFMEKYSDAKSNHASSGMARGNLRPSNHLRMTAVVGN